MKLANLQLKNYGKFKDFSCSLTPGLNVIKGGNETGKSTLVDAITKLLYIDPHDKNSDVLIKAKSWSSDGPPLLKADIQSAEFTGTIEKDFESGIAKLDNNDLNISIDDNTRIKDIITGAIGFSTAELFEATSCIRQGQISHIEGSIKAIKDKLGSLVTGGKEDQAASQIIEKIDQRIEEIARRDDDNPGLLQKLELVQSDIDYNVEKLNRDISNINNWRSNLTQVEVAYANGVEDCKKKQEKLEDVLAAQEAKHKIEKFEEELKEAKDSFEKVKETSKKISELTTQLGQAKDLPRNDRNKIDEMESTLKYLRPKQREMEMDIEADTKSLESHKINSGVVGLALFSLAGIGFGVADYFMRFTEYFLEIGGGGAALLLLSLFIMSRTNAKKSFFKEQIKNKTNKLESVKAEIEQLTEGLNEFLDKYNITSADEARQAVWKRSELENQLKTVKQAHAQLLEGYTEEELEIKVQNLEKDIFDNKIVLENHEEVDDSEVERLKLIVDQLKEQKDNLEKEYTTLVRQIDTSEGGSELLASYMERKATAGGQMAELVEEISILSLTKECIENARQNVMISTLELLEKRTSEILEMITNGKYKEVRFDKSSLKFEVYSKEKKDWVEPHLALSQATIEQIYLTARLALTEILGDKAKPPIILDDTFESFDPERHDGVMKLLKEMALDRQILLLTSDDNYDSWADNTVQL